LPSLSQPLTSIHHHHHPSSSFVCEASFSIFRFIAFPLIDSSTICYYPFTFLSIDAAQPAQLFFNLFSFCLFIYFLIPSSASIVNVFVINLFERTVLPFVLVVDSEMEMPPPFCVTTMSVTKGKTRAQLWYTLFFYGSMWAQSDSTNDKIALSINK